MRLFYSYKSKKIFEKLPQKFFRCFLKDLDPEKAQKLLKSADCSVFQEKAEFDDFGYKRILLEENEKFNLVLMCWPEGSATSIHDHTGSECIMKCLAG